MSTNGQNALTVSAPALPATIDRAGVMKYLGLDPRDPATQAHFVVCERYGLDPLLKHVVIIPGGGNRPSNLYVTRDGLLHVAHASGKFDGLEVEVLPETQTHFVAVATAYRKDFGRPFKFQGRFPKSAAMAKYGPEMAEKVAVCRALRHAFDVALCSREETWEEEPQGLPGAQGQSRNITPMQQPEAIAPAEPISDPAALGNAIKAFTGIAMDSGLGEFVLDPDTARESMPMIRALLDSVSGGKADPRIPAHWQQASGEILDGWRPSELPGDATPEAEIIATDADEDPSTPTGADGLGDGYLKDPFSDDPKPDFTTPGNIPLERGGTGALLDVEAAPVAATPYTEEPRTGNGRGRR